MKICTKNKINSTPLHFVLLFFIIVVNQQTLLSQPIFSPGLVIKTPGDTLQGAIGEFSGNKNYQECVFRSAEGVIQRFTPQEIKGYVITNRRYFESRAVPQPGGDSAFVFVEYLIRSSTSVIKLKKELYLIGAADTLQRVPLRQTAETRTKADYQLSRRNWLLFLNNLARDCETLKKYFSDAKNLESNEKKLLLIIEMYNDCQGASYEVYGASLPLVVADVGISLALDYTNLAFTSTSERNYPYLLEPNFNTLGPSLGIALLVWSPRRLSTFALYLEPSARYFNLTEAAQSTSFPTTADEAYYRTNINWLGVGSPIAIRYTIPNRKPAISFQAGPVLQLLIQPKAETLEELVVQEFGQTRNIVTTNRYAPFEFSDFQLGFAGQVNLRQRWDKLPGSWEFALGFQRGGGITLEDTRGISGLLQSTTTTFFAKTVWFCKRIKYA